MKNIVLEVLQLTIALFVVLFWSLLSFVLMLLTLMFDVLMALLSKVFKDEINSEVRMPAKTYNKIYEVLTNNF